MKEKERRKKEERARKEQQARKRREREASETSRTLKEKFSFHAALDNVWIHRNIWPSVSFVESFNQTRDFESDLGLNISFPQPFQTNIFYLIYSRSCPICRHPPYSEWQRLSRAPLFFHRSGEDPVWIDDCNLEHSTPRRHPHEISFFSFFFLLVSFECVGSL